MLPTWVVVHDGSEKLEWMVQLLEWTFYRVQQPGRFVRVWTSDADPTPFGGDTYQTCNYADYDGEPYPPYNRVCGLADWLRDDPTHPESTIVVLEHDMVFLNQWVPVATPGVVLGNGPWEYLSLDPHSDPDWLSRHCKRPDLLSGAGVPLVATARDLTAIHDGLADRVTAIRQDFFGERNPWVAEMYGVVFAMADAALMGECRWLTEHFPYNWPTADKPLMHYAWRYDEQGWVFDKHTYQPWTILGPPPEGAPETVHHFAEVLDTFAKERVQV